MTGLTGRLTGLILSSPVIITYELVRPENETRLAAVLRRLEGIQFFHGLRRNLFRLLQGYIMPVKMVDPREKLKL